MADKIIRIHTGELRLERQEGDAPKIVGYAAKFNALSEDLGPFREKIAPGAFSETLAAGDDVRALLNHDSNFVLGRTEAGTLSLREDDVGLRAEIDPPTTTWAADLLISMERGDIDQMSFGFQVIDDEMHTEDEENVRMLLRVKLFDVSVVTFPAYPQTNVGVNDLFSQVGLDQVAVSSVIAKRHYGIEISEDEQKVVADFARDLSALCQSDGVELTQRKRDEADHQDDSAAALGRRQQQHQELLSLHT